MDLEKYVQYLQDKKATFLKQWFALIVETYPDQSTRFLKYQKDRFANPVGHVLSREIDRLFDQIVRGVDPETAIPSLDRIIRIRAIQDFSPSQAVAFVFFLKQLLLDDLKGEIQDTGVPESWLAIESRIDQLALLAFDHFLLCRERLYEIRVNEIRRHTNRLLKRAKLIGELSDEGPESEADNN